MAKGKLRKIGKVLGSFWDWSGVVAWVVKLAAPGGGAAAVTLAWIQGLSWWQGTGLALAGIVVVPAIVWGALSVLNAIGNLLEDDEPRQAIDIGTDATGVVATTAGVCQDVSGNSNTTIANVGTLVQHASDPAETSRTTPTAVACCRGHDGFVRVQNPGDVDKFRVKISNFSATYPELTLKPYWDNGEDEIEIKRGDYEDCKIIVSTPVPQTPGLALFPMPGKAVAKFLGGREAQDITVDMERPWNVDVSVVSNHGEPGRWQVTYGIAVTHELVMPFDDAKLVDLREAEEIRKQQNRIEMEKLFERLSQSKGDSESH